MATEQQAGEDEGIRELHETISSIQYRNAIDAEYLMNYHSENDAVMESPTDEEIIQGIMDMPADDDHDLDNSCVLLNISPKKAFQVIITLKNYLL